MGPFRRLRAFACRTPGSESNSDDWSVQGTTTNARRNGSRRTETADGANANDNEEVDGPTSAAPWLVVLTIIELSSLVACAIVYMAVPGFRTFAATRVLGNFPPAIVWFGAVGGSLVSLKGVMQHSSGSWDKKWELWHALRPFVSGITGPVTALFLLVAAEALLPNAAGNKVHLDVFYAISFLAGYREQVLTKSLLKKSMVALVGADPDDLRKTM